MRLLLKILESLIMKAKAMRPAEWLAMADLLSHIADGGLADRIYQFISDEVYEYTGMRLDPVAPLAEASITNAIAERTGIQFRTLRDKEMIKEDLSAYAAGLVSAKSGYRIRSVTDVEMLKADLQQVACAVLSQRIGIPAGVLPGDGEAFDPAAIRERLLTWAKAELYANINQQVGVSLQEIAAIGDVEALAVELSGQLRAMGSDEEITARRLAVYVSNKMATNAVADYGRQAADMSKRTRRQLQLRDAQAKFRAKHGNRSVYVPLGMAATVE